MAQDRDNRNDGYNRFSDQDRERPGHERPSRGEDWRGQQRANEDGGSGSGGYGSDNERGSQRGYGGSYGQRDEFRGGQSGRGGDYERGAQHRAFEFGGSGQQRGEPSGYGQSGFRQSGRDDYAGFRPDNANYGSGYAGREFAGRGDNAYGGSDRGRTEGGRDFWDKASDEVSSWFGDNEAERRRDQDKHRGRGPKGYARSDERIREDVNDRLTDDWSLDASEIEVKVENREVTLSGTVSSRNDKRRAEDVSEQVSGVTHVQNNLRIKQQDGTTIAASASVGIGSTVLGGSGRGGTGSGGTGSSTI